MGFQGAQRSSQPGGSGDIWVSTTFMDDRPRYLLERYKGFEIGLTNKALEHLGEDFSDLLEMKGFFPQRKLRMTRSLNLVSLISTDVLAASSSTESQFCTTLSINLFWRTTWHRPLWCNSGLKHCHPTGKVFVRGGAHHDQFNERALHDVHCEAG